MKSGKLITGLAIGAIVALILVPKTRQMLSDAVTKITDSLSDLSDDINDIAQKGKSELNKVADKSNDIAGSVKTTKEAWQS